MNEINVKDYLQGTFHHLGGLRESYRFPNGYGASVIVGGTPVQHRGEYNIELAVTWYDDEGGIHLRYDTPITNDVEIFKDEQSLEETLRKIAEL